MEDTAPAEVDSQEMQTTLQTVVQVIESLLARAMKRSSQANLRRKYVLGPDHARWECREILQKGSPQAFACAAVVMMPQLNGHGALDLFTRNYVFKAGFWAWLIAQTLKVDSSPGW